VKNHLSVAAYFQRYEQKYLLNAFQYREVLDIINEFACEDEYGLSTVYSVYYDTEDFKITQKSLDKSAYKEKLRLRSYGIPHIGDNVFLELKKKFRGITYKERIVVPFSGVEKILDLDSVPRNPRNNNYIFHEINWFLKYYRPVPQLMICYDRTAFRGTNDRLLRITFDANVRWCVSSLDFLQGRFGTPLLDENEYLMEIKTAQSMPYSLSCYLSKLKIFPLSFSKYRTAYEGFMNSMNTRKEEYA
jgi:SPX domain protein involved in polyphosphate accumulation